MPRGLSAPFIAAMTSPTCRPAYLFEGVFSEYTMRLWSGVGDLSWGGYTWSGNGWLQGFEGAPETDDLSDVSLGVQLSGLPETVINIILSGSRQGATGKRYLAFLNANLSLAADPYLLFQGELDYPTLEEAAADSHIALKYVTSLTKNTRRKEFRFEPETQKLFYPGDAGFNFITATLEWSGFWGKKKKLKEGTVRKLKNINIPPVGR